MNAAWRIGRLEARHEQAYRNVFDAVAREGLYLSRLEAAPPDDVHRFVQESLAKGRPQYVALEGESVLGWCDVVDKQQELLRHSGVLGMGVLREHRGRGIGTALLDATLRDARAKGFRRVELTVRVDNERAKRLYERFGFEVEGLCRRHMRVHGEYKDSYLMAVLYD